MLGQRDNALLCCCCHGYIGIIFVVIGALVLLGGIVVRGGWL